MGSGDLDTIISFHSKGENTESTLEMHSRFSVLVVLNYYTSCNKVVLLQGTEYFSDNPEPSMFEAMPTFKHEVMLTFRHVEI
jgi:sorbitol-specific phosphotransferase system component IIC